MTWVTDMAFKRELCDGKSQLSQSIFLALSAYFASIHFVVEGLLRKEE